MWSVSSSKTLKRMSISVKDGDAPLLPAAHQGHLEIADLLLSSGAFFGGYAAKRTWFSAQKVDYGSYEEGNMRMQHEMELVRQQQAGPPDTAAFTEVSLAQEPPQPPAQAQAANPFQQKSANPFQAASNPFNN